MHKHSSSQLNGLTQERQSKAWLGAGSKHILKWLINLSCPWVDQHVSNTNLWSFIFETNNEIDPSFTVG